MYVYIYVCVCVCVSGWQLVANVVAPKQVPYAYTCIDACMHAYIHIHTHIHICVCIYILSIYQSAHHPLPPFLVQIVNAPQGDGSPIYICLSIYLYIYLSIYLFYLSIYTYIHAYILTTRPFLRWLTRLGRTDPRNRRRWPSLSYIYIYVYICIHTHHPPPPPPTQIVNAPQEDGSIQPQTVAESIIYK